MIARKKLRTTVNTILFQIILGHENSVSCVACVIYASTKCFSGACDVGILCVITDWKSGLEFRTAWYESKWTHAVRFCVSPWTLANRLS